VIFEPELLVKSAEVRAVTEKMLRAQLPKALGEINSVTRVGRTLSTWIVTTNRTRLVVKRMGYERSPRFIVDLFARLISWRVPPCPELLGTIEGAAHWYALFSYVEGATQILPGRKTWNQAIGLLARLSEIEVANPGLELGSFWLDRLARFSFEDFAANDLLAKLSHAIPVGPTVIAHGDFSAQNFCCAERGLVLLDWEEMGGATAGFDAGWVLAHRRLGIGPSWEHAELVSRLSECGLPRFNVEWYEALGLLRMFYRSLTLPIDPNLRTRVVLRVRNAIALFPGFP
jgi:aminoglycoside phosphotransferase (APT) family kinase protein